MSASSLFSQVSTVVIHRLWRTAGRLHPFVMDSRQ
jgi:hypothetical protein